MRSALASVGLLTLAAALGGGCLDPLPYKLDTSLPWEPQLELSPAALDFGEPLEGARLEAPVTLRNAGQLDLEIKLSLAVGDQYTAGPPVLSVGSDDQRVISVFLNATTAGPALDTLILVTNDPDRPQVELPLQATVLPAE
ncbi:MAG: Abnormal spindle-like microcephaly-assocd, ASPM-SPD-2-Hydin [Pseudomonadota bacterium]